MEDFVRLFGGLLALVYHCFDRIVILGHLPLLTRPENIVHFFRDVHGIRAITKEVLRQRTTEYNQWVEAFASNHQVPMEWAEKGVRKEDYVRPWLRRMERQDRCGVYFILKSMEIGTSFRSTTPKYPTAEFRRAPLDCGLNVVPERLAAEKLREVAPHGIALPRQLKGEPTRDEIILGVCMAEEQHVPT